MTVLSKQRRSLQTNRFMTRCLQPTKQDRNLVNRVHSESEKLKNEPDSKLRSRFGEIRTSQQPDAGSQHASILAATLSLTNEALRRTTSMSAYDVQILAGIAMARGAIAEMKTGEGKTLASAFPIVYHALSQDGVHVATVNSYLAERDFEFLYPALDLLGISVGISRDSDSPPAKLAAYACDVTFATGYELGFDFLRDEISKMSRGPDQLGAKLRRDLFSGLVEDANRACNNHSLQNAFSGLRLTQRNHAIAIIDEIDSVLIDEATTPLVLSAGGLASNTETTVYFAARKAAESFELNLDFVVDEKIKSLRLTEDGSQKAQQLRDTVLVNVPTQTANAAIAVENAGSFSLLNQWPNGSNQSNPVPALLRPWNNYVVSALRAKHLMVRDVNYVVREEKIEIVDEYTGRIFSDRNWRDGLHQAVEAKEDVPVTEEKRTIARISRQRYFQRYKMLCGMTGTIVGHQSEMSSCYQTPVVAIPLRKRSLRQQLPTRYFCNEADKSSAIVIDVVERQRVGQPVLIGTRTIQQSLKLSDSLNEAGVAHNVLNGVQDEEEATLIAAAGNGSSVTVATNMAGRGTDIKPNGAALAVGGLHVIGYERNSSCRIDRQLAGRAGRQGDPGSGQFFVSPEDDIVKRFDPGLARILKRIAKTGGARGKSLDRRIQQIQATAEKESHNSRREIMKEELWMDNIKKAVG